MNSKMVDRDQFLQNLRISKLLTSQQFRAVFDQLGQVANPKEIARTLISEKLLTKFQAKMLLAGRNYGFFLGPYRILDLLGQGGMGRVYKAMHQTMNRVVALKILSPQLVKTERAQQLFLREVQAAAKLHHPNIVMAYDANEIEGRHYLAMEFVDGPNLEQYVRTKGTLPIGMACEIIYQAAHGLQHAFERGMVHRDIKPANLLFQQESGAQTIQVKILDFGLARLNQPEGSPQGGDRTIVTKHRTVMGTPDFLSPEQSKDLHEVDIRSDIYSLGCTFYYLLSGQVPFPGGSTIDKLIRHSSEFSQPIEELRPDVPSAIAESVHKMMAKKPVDRYQTPEEIMDALSAHATPSVMDWHNAPIGMGNSDRGLDENLHLPAAQVDTEPRAQASTQISDAESILEWVDTNRRYYRKVRRAFLSRILIIAGLLLLGISGWMVWNLLQP